jgi:hypothetical protein
VIALLGAHNLGGVEVSGKKFFWKPGKWMTMGSGFFRNILLAVEGKSEIQVNLKDQYVE